MRCISGKQLGGIHDWMKKRGSLPCGLTKWSLLFNGGTNAVVIAEMAAYQNDDGGFEADVLLSLSAAIPTAESRRLRLLVREHRRAGVWTPNFCGASIARPQTNQRRVGQAISPFTEQRSTKASP